MSATTNEKILNALDMYNTGLQTKLDDKFVQKDGAKVLSTNDFTDADKAKLDSLSATADVDFNTLTDTFVTKVTGKELSSNDFTDAYKMTIDGLSGVYVQQVSGKDLSTNDFTDAYKTAIDGLSSTYATKSEVASVLIYKGTVANFAAIASDTSIQEGWTYNISVGGGVDEHGIPIKDGDNVAKTATGFDVLAGSIDTSIFVQKDGSKVLSTNDFTDSYKNTIDGLSGVYVAKDGAKVLSTNDFSDAYKTKLDAVDTSTYVQKVVGKDLSTNDFTDAYKATIDGLSGSGGGLTFTSADRAKLNSLPTMSLFMKALLEANNAYEARQILRVGRVDIIDEAENAWQVYQGAGLSTTQKKFGNKSLYCSATNSYMWCPMAMTLGGSDFSIAGWFYSEDAASTYRGLFSFGTGANSLLVAQNITNKLYWYCGTSSSSTVFNNNGAATMELTAGKWNHVEVCYKHSTTTIYLFLNGSLVDSRTMNYFSTPKAFPIYIGAAAHNLNYLFKGWVDEFFVTKKCLHTSDFTVPSAPYAHDSDTIALLHFDEFTLLEGDAGDRWLNYGATFSSTAKFDSISLSTSSGYLQKDEVTLGGKDFSIAGWFYSADAANTYRGLFSFGTDRNEIFVAQNGNNNLYWCCATSSSNTIFFTGSSTTTEFTAGKWNHVEVCYKHSTNTIYLFLNGSLVDSQTMDYFSTPQVHSMYIGTIVHALSCQFKGCIDSFLITEQLLHDADFSSDLPTAPYEADENTIALLNFE